MGYKHKLLCDALCNMYSALLCNSANLGLGGGALGRTRKVAAALQSAVVTCRDCSILPSATSDPPAPIAVSQSLESPAVTRGALNSNLPCQQ